MFDVGFSEVALLFIVTLLVFGPDKLPSLIRSAGLWIGRFKRSYQNMRADIERELGADDIRRQLHNEDIMRSLNSSKEELAKFQSQMENHTLKPPHEPK